MMEMQEWESRSWEEGESCRAVSHSPFSSPSTLSLRRSQLFAWTLLAGLLVFGTMCGPFFLGRVYVADDLGAFHLPIRDFYSRQLAAGEPWDWMPTLYCGFYLTGEGQLGGYHPLHLILYRLLPLGAAFNLELLLNYPFLAVGTYLFLRRLIGRRDAAAFGALVFTFSSFNLLHFVHPNAVAVVAHLPWLLWAIDIACRSDCMRSIRLAQCVIPLLTGSQLLLGYPQYIWFSLLGEAAFAGYCLYRKRRWTRAAGILAALAVGGLIGSVQLLPTVDALASSNRQSADADFRNSGSLVPLNAVQLVAPYLFRSRVVGQNTHELGMYIGAAPLALCVWLLVGQSRNRVQRKGGSHHLTNAFAAFAALALLYSLGEYGPIYRIQAWLPLVNSFRFPCRGIVLFQLASAVVAAIAWTRLIRKRSADIQLAASLWWLPVISLILSCAILAVWPGQRSSALLVVAGPLLMAVAVVLVNECAKGRGWAPAALVLFTAADLAVYGLSYAVLPGTADLNQYAAVQNLPPGSSAGRLVADDRDDPALRTGNRMLLAGYSRADGYAGLEPWHAFDASSPDSLREANVAWVRSKSEWRRVAQSHARVQIDDPAAVLSTVTDAASHLAFRIDGPNPSCLMIAERFHPGWRATLDGTDIPVVAAGIFMACQIPSGSHQLEMRFQPASLRFGGLLTLCGLGFTLSWAAIAMLAPPKTT